MAYFRLPHGEPPVFHGAEDKTGQEGKEADGKAVA